MGASGMNAKRKQKRRRHAEARKKSAEKLAAISAGSAKPAPRRAPKSA